MVTSWKCSTAISQNGRSFQEYIQKSCIVSSTDDHGHFNNFIKWVSSFVYYAIGKTDSVAKVYLWQLRLVFYAHSHSVMNDWCYSLLFVDWAKTKCQWPRLRPDPGNWRLKVKLLGGKDIMFQHLSKDLFPFLSVPLKMFVIT